jgi:hypothetical protein
MPTLLAGATMFSAASSIGGGISGMMASNQEAKLQREQADIALAESRANATNEAYNQNIAVGKQKLAFLSNGVSLEGSPTLVLQESTRYGQQQVQSILDQGAARYKLGQKEAAITQNKGRAALIAGIAQGVGTLSTLKLGKSSSLETPKTNSTITPYYPGRSMYK